MKRVFNISLVIVTFLSLAVSIAYVYYRTIGKDSLPGAITSTYSTLVVDPYTGEELSAIESNYYANKNGQGYEVVELLFNAYSGISQDAIYSRGFQLVDNGKDDPKLYYYDRYDGVSFETGHEYSWGDKMLISIDGKPYAVALDGTYTTSETSFDGLKVARTFYFAGLNLIFEGTSFNKVSVTTHKYTFNDLLIKVKSIIKSSSNGTGKSVIPLIDLGDFLHIYDVDDNGVISSEPIGKNTLINSYFTMDTNYDTRGLTVSEQSLFNSVEYNSNFNISGLLDSVDYWKSESVVTISEDDFVARVTADGNYYSLSLDKFKELNAYRNVAIDVKFNVSNIDEKVLGFDSFCFMGLKLNSLSVYSSSNQDFVLLVDSLKDTGLKNIVTKNINIIDVGGNL